MKTRNSGGPTPRATASLRDRPINPHGPGLDVVEPERLRGDEPLLGAIAEILVEDLDDRTGDGGNDRGVVGKNQGPRVDRAARLADGHDPDVAALDQVAREDR